LDTKKTTSSMTIICKIKKKMTREEFKEDQSL